MALNEDQVQQVRQILAMDGWNKVMLPALRGRGNQALKALTLARSERAASFKGTDFDTDDDVLRAIIRDCEWMVVVWNNEIAVSDHNRTLDELERQNAGATN